MDNVPSISILTELGLQQYHFQVLSTKLLSMVLRFNHLTTFVVYGEISADDILAAIKPYYEDPALVSTLNVLWDYREGSPHPSIRDIEKIASYLSIHATKRAGGKTAIVARDNLEFEVSKKYEFFAQLKGLSVTVEVFRSLGEAMMWLNEQTYNNLMAWQIPEANTPINIIPPPKGLTTFTCEGHNTYTAIADAMRSQVLIKSCHFYRFQIACLPSLDSKMNIEHSTPNIQRRMGFISLLHPAPAGINPCTSVPRLYRAGTKPAPVLS